jgi:dimethylhistidine N-methyltransferase
VDVSEAALAEACRAIARDYPGLRVQGLVADFEAHLEKLPAGPGTMIAFLGGTIGNLAPPARAEFFAKVASILPDDGSLLLGTDLVKDPGRLVRAYDDSAGVTAAFNKNVLAVINRELDADFDPDAFAHVARWNEGSEWIEMRLRSAREQEVTVGRLGLKVSFAAGEEMLTEISAKFRRERVADELRAAGLRLANWWTDPAGDFALSLAHPA